MSWFRRRTRDGRSRGRTAATRRREREPRHAPETELEHKLRRLYALPEGDWYRALDKRLRSRLQRASREIGGRRHRSRLPAGLRLRPIVALAAILAALVLAAGAYAAVSLVDNALSSTPATQPIVLQNLGRRVDLVQTHCGFTVTVGRVYADRHVVVVGYSFTGPAGRAFSPGSGQLTLPTMPTLTTQDGVSLPFLEEGDPFSAVVGNREGRFMTFDAVHAAASKRILHGTLTLPLIQVYERLGPGKAAVVPCESYSEIRANGADTRLVTVQGPYTFSLTMPVMRAMRVANLHQTGHRNGMTVWLDRVEVTPTDVWATIRLAGTRNVPPVEIAVPRHDRSIAASDQDWLDVRPDGLFYRGVFIGVKTVRFALPLYDYHGPWTIAVYTRSWLRPPTGPYHLRPSEEGDPITFRFSVP